MTNCFKSFLLCGVSIVLAACDSSNVSSRSGIGFGLETTSKLVVLEADGTIPEEGFASSGTRGSGRNLQVVNGRTSGFAYQYGRVAGTDRFLGVAGVAPNTDPGGVPTAATATYDGEYQLAHVGDTTDTKRGDITLNADFSAGTLSGAADGLSIDGTISGTSIGGRASYGGVNADMTGVIGTERAVAAFAGNRRGEVLVGGIVAAPR